MNFNVSRTRSCGNTFRYGDCSSCTANACFSVPSKTASPVVFTKSVNRMESFSVSVRALRLNKNPAATIASTTNPAAAIYQSHPPLEAATAAAGEEAGTEMAAAGCTAEADEDAAIVADSPDGVDSVGVVTLTDELLPESISRFNLFKSPRNSDATWYRNSRSFSKALLMMRSSSAGRFGFSRTGAVGARFR